MTFQLENGFLRKNHYEKECFMKKMSVLLLLPLALLLTSMSSTAAMSEDYKPSKSCKSFVLKTISDEYAGETCSRLGEKDDDCIRQKKSCSIVQIDSYDDDDNGSEETVVGRVHCDVGMGFDAVVGYNVIFKTFSDYCSFNYYVAYSYDD